METLLEFPVTCKELREDEIWVDIGLLSAEYVWEKMFGVRGFWRGNTELVVGCNVIPRYLQSGEISSFCRLMLISSAAGALPPFLNISSFPSLLCLCATRDLWGNPRPECLLAATSNPLTE